MVARGKAQGAVQPGQGWASAASNLPQICGPGWGLTANSDTTKEVTDPVDPEARWLTAEMITAVTIGLSHMGSSREPDDGHQGQV